VGGRDDAQTALRSARIVATAIPVGERRRTEQLLTVKDMKNMKVQQFVPS
jgi:hypothetical protein